MDTAVAVLGVLCLLVWLVAGPLLLWFALGFWRGLSIERGPALSVWRGLPLPVPPDQLEYLDERTVSFVRPGSRIAVQARWFENNWTRAGFMLHDPYRGPGDRVYTFHEDGDPSRGVTVDFTLQGQPGNFVTHIRIADERPP